MNTRRSILLALSTLSILLHPCVKAQDAALQDKTLRLNYIFSGDNRTAHISLGEAICLGDGWWGRRHNMDRTLLRGEGDITLCDAETGRVLYRNSFSTLFQEWQKSEEATRTVKSFENVFLLPMPASKATVQINLRDSRGAITATLTHGIDPSDILIRPIVGKPLDHRYIHRSGDSREKIDIAIVAEGYTAGEMKTFYKDAKAAVESIWTHEPFSSMKDRFNIVAVGCPSAQSGVSIPRDGDWRDTALGSHFDTFYTDRYLTTLNLFTLHDILAGIPYEHIIILVNSSTYGGGGIYNSYVLSTAHNRFTSQVVVHEFGHSFGGLADEYYYDDQYEQFYNSDTEPWEPNITTLVDGGAKWKDMVGKVGGVGYFEGAGYMSKGAWRPTEDCRMKTNSFPTFCPVCERAVRNVILYHTSDMDLPQ